MTTPEVFGSTARTAGAERARVDIRVRAKQIPVAAGGRDARPEARDVRIAMNGIGAEIIETPDHDRVARADVRAEIERVLWAYRERILDLKTGHGCGTSSCSRITGRRRGTLEHPHSQLIGLPIVPDFVREEIEGAVPPLRCQERCVFCDIVHQELRDGRRVD